MLPRYGVKVQETSLEAVLRPDVILAVGKEDEEQLKYNIGLNVVLPRMLVLPVPGFEAV